MGGLFSTSYNVQKIGQNVKVSNKKRTSNSVSHDITTTESGNNVFAKSDIEIIGPISEIDNVKKEDAKTVRIDETKTEVFEDVGVREEPSPPPQISDEERKMQEDLIMAMVRGEIHPRDSISNQDEETVIVKTLSAIIAEEAKESTQDLELPQNSNPLEDLCKEDETIETVVQEVVEVQVNERKLNQDKGVELPSGVDEQPDLDNKSTEDTSKSDPHFNETVQEHAASSLDATSFQSHEIQGVVEAIVPPLDATSIQLREIRDVEEVTKKLKEQVINFSSTSKNKEYEELHQVLVNNILKLDDISCKNDEIDTERKRVLKILQQCMQNLERKIENVKQVGSDSE
ncbi:hypothetical protein RI129_009280 [Pyrocoelia pectoralis]|uniref:BAG domain-containing protein n=1 Tax=Pyrocoelia pectoralis TaxID=417401 RepID=A0AAN7ZIV0_9COLE